MLIEEDYVEERLARLEEQLKYVSVDIGDIKKAMVQLSDVMKNFAVCEERHAQTKETLGRAFNLIDSNSRRIKDMEEELPLRKLATNWIFKAMLAVLALLAMAVIGTLFKYMFYGVGIK
jgi:uncharacterized protein YydD (DUF2326 family)